MNDKLKIYACSGVGATSSSVAQELENNAWSRNETLRKYLGTSADGGCAEYFLYIFIPDEELGKYNATIYKKRKQQLKTYEYVRELFVGHNYGTEAEMLNIIRNGIEKTFKMSVEQVLIGVRGGKIKGVGEPISMAVATIISSVITLVIAIISGVISYCQSVKIAKYTAPSMEEIEASAPASTDITTTTKKKGLLVAALAAGGVLLYKLFK